MNDFTKDFAQALFNPDKINDLLRKELQQAIPDGSPRKARRRGLKKLLHKLKKDYVPRMKKYEEAEKIFAGRNSYSKTDHDATFMHMKEDHMKNGQLTPELEQLAKTASGRQRQVRYNPNWQYLKEKAKKFSKAKKTHLWYEKI